LYGDKGEDVIYGGDGNDFLDASLDGQRDKLYCGKGKDEYVAEKIDHVSSSCEKKVMMVPGLYT
jgi:Ca2+-binding RTX toxin-like protein